MRLSGRLRCGAVVAALAVALTAAPSTASAAADPTPTPSRSVPSAAEVERAQRAAAAAAAEVADITAQLEQAQVRLETLQRGVSEAVAAQERAQQQLADAEEAVRQATVDVAAAGRARVAADSELSAGAALMYMQGGDLQNLTTLLLSPPGVMSDLTVVLDANAHQVRENLDAATSAAVDAAAKERLLVSARDSRDVLLDQARVKRAATEKEAERAGAQAATLGEEQEKLTARLDALQDTADDLSGLREAAARLGRTDLLGLQAPAGAPRAAQEIARSMMPSHGWDAAEFTCLVALWNAESGWSWSATNPSSGAYGIPQSLPGWKMASAGSDWLTNPATQITWGLGYIEAVYGSPCTAYDRFLARSPHWY